MIHIGDRIKELRCANSLTQKQLAERLEVSSQLISSYERNERSPSYHILVKMSRIFKVSTDYLLGVDNSATVCISELSPEQQRLIIALVKELSSM